MKKGADPLQLLPGVGPSIAADLRALGFAGPRELAGRDPEELFEKLCALRGPQDRCVLYVFRCAVYFAGGGRARGKLKWWNWKDSRGRAARASSRRKKE